MAHKETISLNAKDNVRIVGDYYAGSGEAGMLLLHMMPSTRASWSALIARLLPKGHHILAIDFRGHGASEGGPDGYKTFSNAGHQRSFLDVEIAAAFLKQKGARALHIIGASIGANLALQYLTMDPDVLSAVLLSPGLNYRGIETLPLVGRVRDSQRVYFVGSRDDVRSDGSTNADQAKRLFQASAGKKFLKIFDDAGHGTIIFERHPEFMDMIARWWDKNG